MARFHPKALARAVRRPAAALFLVLTFALPAGAQTREPCELVFETNPDRPTLFNRLPSGATNVFAGGGVRGVCKGQDITLTADSAEYYGDQRLLYLLGNVRYRESRARLDSRRLTYWMNEERLLAEGDVVVTLPSGAVSRGPVVNYLRAAPAVRTIARMEALQRTVTRIPQKDSAGTVKDTAVVVADRTISLADSIVFVGGKVNITRGDIVATADSAFMDQQGDTARLINNARVDAKGERPFTLTAVIISLFSRDQELQRVLARTTAKATSEDLELTSDTIDLRIENDLLQRAHAWGPSRARAVSPGRVMIADSLDVRMPAQKLTEVHLLRDAYAESEPDSTRIRTGQRDWIRGDTIVALFDTTTADADSSDSPNIRELVATGRARSFYQVVNAKGGPTRPSINYVRGREIVLFFRNDEVDDVTVRDGASGVYLEPGEPRSAPSTAQPAQGARPAAGRGRPRP